MYRARAAAFALISVVVLSASVVAPGAAGGAASPAHSRSASVRAAAVRAAAVPSPSMTATPAAGLTQDDGVDVNGFGFIPDGFVVLEWCTTHGGFCRYNLTTRADADGNFADLMRAEFRTSTSGGAPSDCNVEGCFARATKVTGTEAVADCPPTTSVARAKQPSTLQSDGAPPEVDVRNSARMRSAKLPSASALVVRL